MLKEFYKNYNHYCGAGYAYSEDYKEDGYIDLLNEETNKDSNKNSTVA